MGNTGSTGGNNRSRRHGSGRRSHPPPPTPVTPQPEITANRFVLPAATPYPSQYPNPNPPPYYQYPGYYHPPPPAMPVPLPAPYDHHHRMGPHPQMDPALMDGRYPYPCGPPMPPPPPYVEHQKAVTIRNDVNIKKETLRIEPDEENPGRFLVAFTFDATVVGRSFCGTLFPPLVWNRRNVIIQFIWNRVLRNSPIPNELNSTFFCDPRQGITIFFFAKEDEGCNLTPMKANLLPPVTVHFEQGLGQKFRQRAGSGIDFSVFEESELLKVSDMDVYPLAVKADATSIENHGSTDTESPMSNNSNSQITQAVFEKEKGEFQVKVVKQILWVYKRRYELQEIYGIINSVDSEDMDENDPGKECVICLSEPRDTTVLPCRHMCMCSGCAKVLRFQTNRCPICRQPVERLLEIKVNNGSEE